VTTSWQTITTTPTVIDYGVNQVVPTAGNYAVRTMYSSVTGELVASRMADQGSVFAGQFAPTCAISPCMGAVGIDPSGDAVFQPLAYFDPPLDETTMALMSPNYYQAEAREGFFLPLKLTGPTQPFATRSPVCMAAPISALPQIILPFTNNGQVPANRCVVPKVRSVFTPFSSASAVTPPWWCALSVTDTAIPIATGIDNINQGMIIFRNLVGTTATTLPASIRIRRVVGLEIVPEPFSVDRVFTRPPAGYDQRALEAYYALSREMEAAYPARDNALAGILAVAAKVAAHLWPIAKMVAPVALKYIESRISSASSKPPPRAATPPPKPKPKASPAKGSAKKLAVSKR
jgi:hypothetical protein